jgi:hypothetical protein
MEAMENMGMGEAGLLRFGMYFSGSRLNFSRHLGLQK